MAASRYSLGTDSPDRVTFKKPRPGRLPHYELHDDQLSHGASLANAKIWVTTKATGAIAQVFSNGAGANLLGSVVVTYAVPSQVVITSSPEPQCLDASGTSYVLAEQEGVGTMEIFPFSQRHLFELTGQMSVVETILVPKLVEEDPPVALQQIEVTNETNEDVSLLVTIYAEMRGDMGDDLVVEFDKSLGALIVYNESRPEVVRIIGAEGCGMAYRTTHDVSEGYAGPEARRLDNDSLLQGAPLGQLQLDLSIGPSETLERTIVAVASCQGIADAKYWYERAADFKAMLQSSSDFLTPVVSVSMVETPDPVINQGVFWAKANMVKVVSDYPEGKAFTNEPGVSTNVVGRDAAWFVYGNDFLDPHFSAQLLRKFAEKQYPSGKIPEYYNAIKGNVEDYGISLNDDTPLFVLACCHHYAATHDKNFLTDVYENVKRALDYISEQREDTGLVISQADGYEVQGIASWRNVIPNYQINGAVTEINSECYAAFRDAVALAKEAGREDDAVRFDQAARDLKIAINYGLFNRENGLYYLNIDSGGNAHSDVTSDEIFPVLFGVAPADVERRVISRLRSADFMTAAGLRTCSRRSPDYEPSKLIGLRGGVWPGVAFWYAMAAAETNPEFMVHSLHAGYEQYLTDPRKNNTVPGQFSEWFDGESMVNRGMCLSPWEPPRLLWAAVEGLCGARPGVEGFELEPNMPPDWRWLALRRMPCPSGSLTFFVTRQEDGIHIYANQHVSTRHSLHVVGKDVTHNVRMREYRMHRAAFLADDGLTICLGNESEGYVTGLIEIIDLLEPTRSYKMSVYVGHCGWIEVGERPGEDLNQIAVSFENGEFRIIKLSAN